MAKKVNRNNPAHQTLKKQYIRCTDEYFQLHQLVVELAVLSNAYYEYEEAQQSVIYTLIYDRIQQLFRLSGTYSARLSDYDLKSPVCVRRKSSRDSELIK